MLTLRKNLRYFTALPHPELLALSFDAKSRSENAKRATLERVAFSLLTHLSLREEVPWIRPDADKIPQTFSCCHGAKTGVMRRFYTIIDVGTKDRKSARSALKHLLRRARRLWLM